jgi:hypothetical protein
MILRNTPRTSVVIPARNAAATLSQTLDSLIAQTDESWEAIVVDDRSSDATASLVASYAARDARIRCIGGAGEGVSAARNAGIADASGNRMLFLDSDDWVAPAFLESMNAALDAAPGTVAAYCGYARVSQDGTTSHPHSDASIADNMFAQFARHCAVAIHSVLLERSVVAQVGGFDTSLATCEDWDFWQRVSRVHDRWAHVSATLSYYRMTPQSLGRSLDLLMRDGAIVIERGFSSDSRLSNLVQAHPDGASAIHGRTCTLAKDQFLLWCGAMDAMGGGTGARALESLSNAGDLLQSAHQCADYVVHGAARGACAVPEEFAAGWHKLGAPLVRYIESIGEAAKDSTGARSLLYRVEALLLAADGLEIPRPLQRTLGLRVDLSAPVDTVLPAGIDMVYARLVFLGGRTRDVQLSVLGTVTAAEWLAFGLRQLGPVRMLPSAPFATVRALGVGGIAGGVSTLVRDFRKAVRERDRPALRTLLPDTLSQTLDTARTGPNHRTALAERRVRAHGDADVRVARANIATEEKTERAVVRRADGNRLQFWEEFFEAPDPWNYRSPYEQEKYERQLRILPDAPIRRAVELACAEGHFTQQLATRVETLRASDISPTAVSRAKQRCEGLSNIEFSVLDFISDTLPDNVDLFFCSEVLYYVESEELLRGLGATHCTIPCARRARDLRARLPAGG